jgi:hypothetical protein
MGDMRQRIEGAAAVFARHVDVEGTFVTDEAGPILPDDPRGDPSAVEASINDIEAALNPDEHFNERAIADDQIDRDLESEEGRAGD